MKMKRIRVNTTTEDLILTGMIVSNRFLKDVQNILDLKLFKSSRSKVVARWCLNYYRKFEKAPKAHIQDIFNEQVENEKIEEGDVQLIGRLLERISKEHERKDNFNANFVLKQAEKFFGSEHLKETCETILDTLESDFVQARSLMEEWKPKELPSTQGATPSESIDSIIEFFEEKERPLFEFSGDFGKLMNQEFIRGNFIGVMGMEKSGKSYTLMEMAWKASFQRLNVLYVHAGDMIAKQQLGRYCLRASKATTGPIARSIYIPVHDCMRNQNDSCDKNKRKCKFGLDLSVEDNIGFDIKLLDTFFEDYESKKDLIEYNFENGYEPCDVCRKEKDEKNYKGAVWYKKEKREPISLNRSIKSIERIKKSNRTKEIIFMYYSSDTLTCNELQSIMERKAEEGTPIDVLIVDYADLLTHDSRDDFRHRENAKWKGLRRISQDYNCLVITATQADAASYKVDTLELSNFSEDKRKYAHVTSFLAISQTKKEKVKGIVRMSRLISREQPPEHRQVAILQCLDIGQPYLGSYYTNH